MTFITESFLWQPQFDQMISSDFLAGFDSEKVLYEFDGPLTFITGNGNYFAHMSGDARPIIPNSKQEGSRGIMRYIVSCISRQRKLRRLMKTISRLYKSCKKMRCILLTKFTDFVQITARC